MALQKTVQTPQGFDAVNAYHRVDDISLQSKSVMRFFVKSYRDSEATPQFDEAHFDIAYDMNGSNCYVQAYEYLKTLSDFADATDV